MYPHAYTPFSLNAHTYKHLLCIVICALFVRLFVFWYFTQHQERYHQADSMDYHVCATMLAAKQALYHPQTREPIFWRTPGYPLFLAPFYKYQGVKNLSFADNSTAHKSALWVQIFLCALTPLLIFFLSLLLTGSLRLSFTMAWIFVFHIGFVLASGYLLTDGIAMLFFFLFLIFLYQSFSLKGEQPVFPIKWYYLIPAALSLGLYTWLRPNGEFVAFIAVFLLLISNMRLEKKLLSSGVFLIVFYALLFPWCWRNYQLTGHAFFCPMSGPYLLAFNTAKILRSVSGKPLDKCINHLQYLAQQEKIKEQKRSPYFVPKELVSKKIVWPWIQQYPHYFIRDWLKEVCKSTFDLYASQLVAFANNSYTFDALEEFLWEKIQLCLFKQAMPFFMRLLCWFEFLWSLFIWFGIFAGALLFFIAGRLWYSSYALLYTYQLLWIKLGIMIAGLLGMTGGFGYARLRMPAEPLLILLSLTFWLWLYDHSYKKKAIS